MPFSQRIMSLIGVWGSRDRFYRFCIIFSYGIIIVLFPKAVLGIGSSDYGAIAKGIGEFLFEFVIFAFMVIFVTKRRHFEAMIYELTDMFKKGKINYFRGIVTLQKNISSYFQRADQELHRDNHQAKHPT